MEKWKYVKDTNLTKIKEAEKNLSYEFPNEFVEFVLINNGGTPNNNVFYICDGSQKLFGKLLSFNKDDKENVFISFDSKYKNDLIPIANDVFGNLICFDRKDNSLVFWEHETDECKYIVSNWNTFVNDLYDLDNVDLSKEIRDLEAQINTLEKYRHVYELEKEFPDYEKHIKYNNQDVESVLSSKFALIYYVDELNEKTDKELDVIKEKIDKDEIGLDVLSTMSRLTCLQTAATSDEKNREYFKYKITKIKNELIKPSNTTGEDLNKLINKIDEKLLELELEEAKEKAKKTDYGYEYTLNGIDVLITNEELSDEIINYANKFVHFYMSNIEKINNHVFEKLERVGWYVNDYSKEEILSGIGKPVLYVDDVNWASVSYIGNKLDEHMITVEVANEFELGYVSVDG